MNGTAGAFGYFWLHRLHSLAGIILAAAFFFCFLIPYAAIADGPAAFNRVMAVVASVPTLGWFELLSIAAPLTFHALMGILIVTGGSLNVLAYGFYHNWMYALQRAAGLFLIPFLCYHIYATKLLPAFGGRPLDEATVHRLLSGTSSKVFYAAGIACAAFYIGNGFALAAKAWGLTATRRSRDIFSIIGWIATLLIAAWGMRVIFAF
jgi:succinate dehydrogenase / fumarate reductase, cytochrome b subunit